MLSDVNESIASASTASAPSATASGAALTTAFAGTSHAASVPIFAMVSGSNKRHIISLGLVVVVARALHFTGFCSSLIQVALLAGLGGGICYGISAVSVQGELSG